MIKAGMLLSVTDNQLFVTKYVTLIFLIILLLGGALNIYKLFKSQPSSLKYKIRRCVFAFVLFVSAIFVFRFFDIESNLLNNAKFTNGTTIDYCSAFAKGRGIEFEYEVNGKKYRNCNTFHPISEKDITVPDGKYYVRYSEKYPDIGRMDFNRPLE